MDDRAATSSIDDANGDEPQWQALSAPERRILGVLVEKAKTTPENYPLSLNAVRVGANQKSNRSPQMQLDDEQIEDALEVLRRLGVVTEVHGSGRVPKYRHLAYEWLGVERVELAVMAELLLRGDQTVGDLRARSARMESIADQVALGGVLSALEQKGLVVYLTPEGRGRIVTHALYKPQELEALRAKYGSAQSSERSDRQFAPPPTSSPVASDVDLRSEVSMLRREVEQLRTEVAQLRSLQRGDSSGNDNA